MVCGESSVERGFLWCTVSFREGCCFYDQFAEEYLGAFFPSGTEVEWWGGVPVWVGSGRGNGFEFGRMQCCEYGESFARPILQYVIH